MAHADENVDSHLFANGRVWWPVVVSVNIKQ